MSFRDARSSASVHISSRSCLQLSWCQRKPQKGRGPSSSVTVTKPARVSDNTPPKPLSLPLQLNRGKSSPTCPGLFLYSHGVPRHGQCAHEPWATAGRDAEPCRAEHSPLGTPEGTPRPAAVLGEPPEPGRSSPGAPRKHAVQSTPGLQLC